MFRVIKGRGYEVSIGKVGERKIDFIAVKEDKKMYIQVCYLLANQDIFARELMCCMK